MCVAQTAKFLFTHFKFELQSMFLRESKKIDNSLFTSIKCFISENFLTLRVLSLKCNWLFENVLSFAAQQNRGPRENTRW